MDMHSGGRRKLDWSHIYIEAPEEEAKIIFYNIFDRNPDNVTCSCCGCDYSTDENPTLEDATGYDRGCLWVKNKSEGGGGHYIDEPDPERMSYRPYMKLSDYIKTVKVIWFNEIKSEEREGQLPDDRDW